jgi:hypothetical protein
MVYDSMCVFKNREEIWMKKLEELIKYLDEHKQKPSQYDKNAKNKNLSIWLRRQKQLYKLKERCMSNPIIYNKWTDFINNAIYKQYFISKEELWNTKLGYTIEYIRTNNSLPEYNKKNKHIVLLRKWIDKQNINFKKQHNIMKEEIYRIKWIKFKEEYKHHFISNKEYWCNMHNKLIKYIDTYNILPLRTDKTKEIQDLCIWTDRQKINFKTKTCIMRLDEEIYNIWLNFTEKYKHLLLSLEERWKLKLQMLIDYVEKHKTRPRTDAQNKESCAIDFWYVANFSNYKKNEGLMKNDEIRCLWESFLNKYHKQYFLSDEERWYENFEKVKQYIDINGYKPKVSNDSSEIRELSHWITSQQVKYAQQKFIMKEKKIYDTWTNFIKSDKYSKFFVDIDVVWNDTFEKAKEYIIINKTKPSSRSNDENTKKLGIFLIRTCRNYRLNKLKIKNPEIRNKWKEFIENPIYGQYFDLKT